MKYAWLNEKSRKFLATDYLREGQTPEQRIEQIAEAAEKRLWKGFADEFKDCMSKGWFSLSSPVWANYGLDRGLPCSCNGSYISDTMDSILSKSTEIGFMTKYGAGTSAYYGDLRAKGAPISDGGKSTGPVHFMEIADTIISVVSQSSIRRGSCAVWLPVEHPDIMDFLKIKSIGHRIQELSFGVCISDEWMRGLLRKDKEKIKIWGAIIKRRFEVGYPYIFFTDNANNNAPSVYKKHDKKIHASNLCVTGDQRVVSNYGLRTAKELWALGEELTLFDNSRVVKSSPMKLIEKNVDVFKITLNNGMSHSVTSYHKVLTRKSKSGDPVVVEDTECKDLKVGDLVAIQTQKGIFGNINMPDEAFLLGLYQADGTQDDRNIHLCIWENDFDLEEEIQSKFDLLYKKYDGDRYIDFTRSKTKEHNPKFNEQNIGFSSKRKRSLISPFLRRALDFEKGYVPHWIWAADEETQWQYVRGLFYADGTVNITEGNGNPFYLSICNISESFLKELQILLLNLGIRTALSVAHEAGDRFLPDGNGGHKLYACKTAYRLVCGSKNDGIEFEKNTGFLSRKGINLGDGPYRDNTKKFIRIKSIEYIGKEDVYCVNVESDNHHWICNGLITHNCTEIMLSSCPDESFVCVLSSINLAYYDDWKDTNAVEILTAFLDTVTSEYIEKTANNPHMVAPYNFCKRQRAIGLGVLGWHSLLQKKMIPFESMEAKFLNSEIFDRINRQSLEASRKLAKLFGEPELMVGTGERMSTRLAVAPTKSSSFILEQVTPSIEPMFENYGTQKLAKGTFTYKNPFLVKLLKEKGQYSEDVMKSILDNYGSIKHLPFLSEKEKGVFATFQEISQKEIVIQAAARQKYIDQGQSLNLFIHPDTPPKEVSQLLIFGWESGIKSFYYQIGRNAAQEASKKSLNECVSCEA
jgi:ribonucleoside-diphosphate reductase alpha chain